MRFPIDVVYVASDGEVLNIHEHVPPWRLVRPHGSAHAVLELQAGSARALGLQPGDRLRPTDD